MKTKINNIIKDMVTDLLFYDRREDEDLPLGKIEQMIKSGEITIDEMVDTFREELESNE